MLEAVSLSEFRGADIEIKLSLFRYEMQYPVKPLMAIIKTRYRILNAGGGW